MSRVRAIVFVGLMSFAAAAAGGSSGAAGSQYRLIGSGPASVAASATSMFHQAQLAGGSGAAVGIAASANISVVAGPVSQQLPTERVFRDGLED